MYCICPKLCMYESEFFSLWALYLGSEKMANIIDFRFKVHDKSDDEIFIIKIAWQMSVEDAIPTIKQEMAIRYNQDSDIQLFVDNPNGPARELRLEDRISKHFDIDRIKDGLILIYPQ